MNRPYIKYVCREQGGYTVGEGLTPPVLMRGETAGRRGRRPLQDILHSGYIVGRGLAPAVKAKILFHHRARFYFTRRARFFGRPAPSRMTRGRCRYTVGEGLAHSALTRWANARSSMTSPPPIRFVKTRGGGKCLIFIPVRTIFW